MISKNNKIVISFLPFILLICSFIAINLFSRVEPNSFDQNWTTRRFIIGLFVFTSISFLPSLLQLSFNSEFPFISGNLSHHSFQNQSSHEMKFNNHSICTGCFGTSVSILLGNTLLLLYFFSDTEFVGTQMTFFLWSILSFVYLQ